eukprot:3076255-Pyramimonas_sp.AAC.2
MRRLDKVLTVSSTESVSSPVPKSSSVLFGNPSYLTGEGIYAALVRWVVSELPHADEQLGSLLVGGSPLLGHKKLTRTLAGSGQPRGVWAG